MDVMTAILERTSYRGRYEEVPVPEADLKRILEAGLAAPSGCNKQTVSLIAVNDAELLGRLYDVVVPPVGHRAPAMICVLTQRIPAYRDRCFSVQDYSAAIENMLLAIVGLGYQSCWIEGHITDADAEQAAEIAQATEFISAKPEGFDSPIAQGGSNVSGGQKQRLSIARAIAKHPQIYLFDDSFSALDYKTDVALRRALKAKTDNATVIIVAQRISTVLHANQILVLDEGRIVGKGTHAQLMESCPAYQEIARSQLSQKELNLQKEGE